ncbi:restriction endonuclease subunit S [Alkalibacterium gilvum]|uniref:restriction endonuclease subunit S n=1 Tax=Alkalibacterium gilvum TaxID=1130080 RepID=UPI003F900DAF
MISKVQLSDICNIKYGKDHKKLNDGSIPVYGTGGIMRYVDSTLYDKESVLIPRKGTLGNLFYVDEPFWSIDTLFYTEIDQLKVIPKYLFYKLKTLDLKNMNVGTAVPSLTTALLNEIELYLPSLSYQHKIVNILTSFDEKIENNNAIIANLEEQAQAVFKSWFVDFEPFQDGKFVDSELGKVPLDWDVVKLKKISEQITTGKTPPTKDPSNYGNKMPFVTIPDMHDNVFVTETERMLSSKGIQTQKNKVVPKNSLAVSCIATVGLVTLISEDSQTNQQINTVVTKDNVSPYYVYSYLKKQTDYLNAIGSSGSTTKNVNKSTFSNLKLLLPKEEVLEKYHKLCEPIFEYILLAQKQNIKLVELRDTLLPKLISGEIRVEEAAEIE